MRIWKDWYPGLRPVPLEFEIERDAPAGGYARALIPSTYRYDELLPWGSQPLTDPLLGTSRLTIVHDGADFSRADKIGTIAGGGVPEPSPVAIDRSLRRSRRLTAALQVTRRLGRTPVLGRLRGPLERWLRAGTLSD